MKSAVAALALLLISPALAHEAMTGWQYPARCCGGQDCEMIPASTVKWTKAGWYIVNTGETIPEGKAYASPDSHFHRCRQRYADPNSKTRCLFVPGFGT